MSKSETKRINVLNGKDMMSDIAKSGHKETIMKTIMEQYDRSAQVAERISNNQLQGNTLPTVVFSLLRLLDTIERQQPQQYAVMLKMYDELTKLTEAPQKGILHGLEDFKKGQPQKGNSSESPGQKT